MDTKWKSMKRIFSLLTFFAGVSLTLWNVTGIFQRMPTKLSDWSIGRLTQTDYQTSSDFRQYIAGRLEAFLSVAVKGSPAGWDYDGWDYYGTDSAWESEYTRYLEEMAQCEDLTLTGMGSAVTEFIDQGIPIDQGSAGNAYYYGGWEPEEEKQLTEEEKKRIAERKEKLTKRYFAGIEQDKNLLYGIYYEGKLLYSNGDLDFGSDGLQAPEGYNFLLYFDGEKVRIVKDGEEKDIYRDGYYRGEDGEWYVPGYRNFPADEGMKKAVICMAAAENPVQYTSGFSNYNRYNQQENALYWMQYHFLAQRALLRRSVAGLAAGLGLLLISFFFRRERREALERIAAFQGKIWVECKAVLVIFPLLAAAGEYFRNGSAWRELTYYAGDILLQDGAYTGYIGGWLLSDLRYLSGGTWAALFWTVYLLANDLRHNKKIWRQGLIAKCCRTFTAREMKLPLARRMACRGGILLCLLCLFGIFTMGILSIYMENCNLWRDSGAGAIFASWIFVLLAILLTAYLMGRKNVKTAREIDALSERIGDICRGKYSDAEADGAGDSASQADRAEGTQALQGGSAGTGSAGDGRKAHRNLSAEADLQADLGAVMAQLDNIRQGMAEAVDEQMKSERMKVELIANVSHDLKTPLTSIISYVQFLKEEEGLPEHVKDYVRILDDKSQRLKNMVQDVFAVSKAASGELPLNMEKLDFNKLLRQTLADMDEQIRGSRVSFRTELPEEPVMIYADGQRMYRVFQNLFQNALKYSLDGSRVYVALKADGKMAVASVKNTSHMELAEDNRNLTERFVRGDKSRTDGGSGLGLSIAQSFTEACGGKFELESDADLFIVRVTFMVDAS